jgi:hypothetical protein
MHILPPSAAAIALKILPMISLIPSPPPFFSNKAMQTSPCRSRVEGNHALARCSRQGVAPGRGASNVPTSLAMTKEQGIGGGGSSSSSEGNAIWFDGPRAPFHTWLARRKSTRRTASHYDIHQPGASAMPRTSTVMRRASSWRKHSLVSMGMRSTSDW